MHEIETSDAAPPEVGRHVIRLDGCRPTPLGTYLKALGVLRLVSEQADPDACGWWQDETFLLKTVLSADGLRMFFLEGYAPTPILAPWNGGSGFYPKDNTEAIDAIAGGAAERFRYLRLAIHQMRNILADEGLEERPEGAGKERLLSRLRAEADENLLAWMDAAVVLTGPGPKYPPLLGTGGNDGRLDFTNNFMARLLDVIDPQSGEPTGIAGALLNDALFAMPVAALEKAAIGQFAPGAAGGPNASTDFTGEALVNSWDFVLMLEGAVLFAAAAARRLEGIGGGQLAYPFTVRSTGSGSGNTSLSDEGSARAETWMPLWDRPAALVELRGLLGEGRVVIGRNTARDGLDFSRAVAKLGVERGITSFQRYAYLMRAGRAYLATPLARVAVRRNPTADLIDQLEQGNWLRRFRTLGRSRDQPARLTSLVRRLENGLFALSEGSGRKATAVQHALTVLGEVQRYLASSPKAREACRPVPVLGWEWVRAANDGSAEFRVAAALAGIHGKARNAEGPVLPMAIHFAPIASGRGRIRRWDPETHHRVVWGTGSLHENLVQIMRRRLLEARSLDLDDLPLHGTATAPVAATSAWLAGDLADSRIADLLLGLSLTRIPQRLKGSSAPARPSPAAYALLKPLFTTHEQLWKARVLREGVALPPPKEVLRLLDADRPDDALKVAHHTLRSRGLVAPEVSVLTPGVTGPRLLSVLMVPLSDSDLGLLLRRLFVWTAGQFADNPENA